LAKHELYCLPCQRRLCIGWDGTGCYLAEQPKTEFCGQMPETLLSQAVDLVLIKQKLSKQNVARQCHRKWKL